MRRQRAGDDEIVLRVKAGEQGLDRGQIARAGAVGNMLRVGVTLIGSPAASPESSAVIAETVSQKESRSNAMARMWSVLFKGRRAAGLRYTTAGMASVARRGPGGKLSCRALARQIVSR
jgi:hypothetical protein